MRSIRPVAAVYLCFVLVLSTSAQQSLAPPRQAPALLQSAFAALGGANPVTDVTLTGTARRIVGSDDESGTATLKAVSGASRLDLSFPSGQRSEVRNASGDKLVGTWSGPDGVSHGIAFHNLLTEPAWFFPNIALLYNCGEYLPLILMKVYSPRGARLFALAERRDCMVERTPSENSKLFPLTL
ncbi:MAG TPA: hypothetical protein VHF01_16215 [Candidatus Acidoferrum sp.]|nr:hypothetical protein [Candidatus Acidoferrum sp.]